jgi:hypothetical protein
MCLELRRGEEEEHAGHRAYIYRSISYLPEDMLTGFMWRSYTDQTDVLVGLLWLQSREWAEDHRVGRWGLVCNHPQKPFPHPAVTDQTSLLESCLVQKQHFRKTSANLRLQS